MKAGRRGAPGRRLSATGPVLLSLLALGACGPRQAPQGDNATGQPQAVQDRRINAGQTALPGTPMAERVAVIGLLNKRNGITRKLSMKPGQALRVGNAIVRLRACETAAPWEEAPETGAFVQLDVQESRDNQWHRVFSGWLFKERPERNVVQHPIYDVWVMSCAMTWPEFGEETVRMAARAGSRGSGGNATAASASDASSADQSAAAAPSAASAASNSAE